MQCQEAQTMMNALVDGELPHKQADCLHRHFEDCQPCAREFNALRTLVRSLDAMSVAKVPVRLARKTMQRFRAEHPAPSFIEWWQNLGFGLRSATCSVIIAGLLLGFGLGASLTSLQNTAEPHGLVTAVHFTGGILP